MSYASMVVRNIYYAWCTRTEDCYYTKMIRDTVKNRNMVAAQMSAHGNAHRTEPRRTKKQMMKLLGDYY